MADQFDSFSERLARTHPIGDLVSKAKDEFDRFSELEKTSDGRRRYDLEKYALVALAIGQYPKNPPEWALQACSELHQREAGMFGSILTRKPDDPRYKWLEEIIQTIISAHTENLHTLSPNDEFSGGAGFDDITSAVFKETRPNSDGSVPIAFATIAKRIVEEKNGPDGGKTLESDTNKHYLQEKWLKLGDDDRRNLIYREFRKYLKSKRVDTHRPS